MQSVINEIKPNKGLISNKLARIVSTLFVPPSIALLTMIYFAFAFEKKIISSFVIISVTLLFGFTLPIIVFFYLKKQGKIFDIDATIKEERTTPFIIGIILYSIGLIIMLLVKVNIFTIFFWFTYITNTIILININRYWKISVHALGVSGPLAALTYILGWVGFSFVWLLLLVGWARIKLKVHTPAQVLAGSLLGFLLTYLQMFIISGLLSNVIKR